MKIEEVRSIADEAMKIADGKLNSRRCCKAGDFEIVFGKGKKKTGGELYYTIDFDEEESEANFSLKIHLDACKNYIGHKVNGIIANDLKQVVTLIIQHEVSHYYDVLQRGFTRHDLKFKKLVNYLFGHTETRLEKICRTEATHEQVAHN